MSPPTITIVIAQCVQRSFISPLPGPDPRLKPCHLHCGYTNAVRLLGGGPQSLPNILEDFLWHVHGGEDGAAPGSEHVHVIYVDDEHVDDGSELTEQHFAQFGRHCVPGEVDERGVAGYLGTGHTAEWRELRNGRTHVVRTPGLNDNMFGTGFIPVLTSICQEAEEVYGVRPEDIQILNIGGWSIIKELFCGVWELLHHGIPDYRALDNREATIRFRRVALSDALSYSVQREHHNIALDVTRMIGGLVLRTPDDALAYCGLRRAS
ncbi:MAG TPA: hypothetical protein VFO07_20370 [Roseiflexaceae bacterium]|nr:hypothetical protein [Roseiflexaceae bacterium]